MKKVWIFLGIAFVTIAAVMLYLVKNGVSLRPALYIKPSPMNAGIQTVARDVSMRLFPDLQQADYVVWGVPDTKEVSTSESAEFQEFFELLKAEEEKTRGKKISVLPIEATAEALSTCQTPCWILRPHSEANSLKPNPFLQNQLQPMVEKNGRHYFTLTVSPFQFQQPVPDECWAERRLDFVCIRLVAVDSVQRKMPQQSPKQNAESNLPPKRYFFLNKYNESDFFLFIEKPAYN